MGKTTEGAGVCTSGETDEGQGNGSLHYLPLNITQDVDDITSGLKGCNLGVHKGRKSELSPASQEQDAAEDLISKVAGLDLGRDRQAKSVRKAQESDEREEDKESSDEGNESAQEEEETTGRPPAVTGRTRKDRSVLELSSKERNDESNKAETLVKLEEPSFVKNEEPATEDTEDGQREKSSLLERGPDKGRPSAFRNKGCMQTYHNNSATEYGGMACPQMPANFVEYGSSSTHIMNNNNSDGSKRGIDQCEIDNDYEPLKYVRPPELQQQYQHGYSNIAVGQGKQVVNNVFKKQMSGGTVFAPEPAVEQLVNLSDLKDFQPGQQTLQAPQLQDTLDLELWNLDGLPNILADVGALVNDDMTHGNNLDLANLTNLPLQQETAATGDGLIPSNLNFDLLAQQQQKTGSEIKRSSYGSCGDDFGYSSDSPLQEVPASPESQIQGSPERMSTPGMTPGRPCASNWSPPPSNFSVDSGTGSLGSPMSEDGGSQGKSPRHLYNPSPALTAASPSHVAVVHNNNYNNNYNYNQVFTQAKKLQQQQQPQIPQQLQQPPQPQQPLLLQQQQHPQQLYDHRQEQQPALGPYPDIGFVAPQVYRDAQKMKPNIPAFPAAVNALNTLNIQPGYKYPENLQQQKLRNNINIQPSYKYPELQQKPATALSQVPVSRPTMVSSQTGSAGQGWAPAAGDSTHSRYIDDNLFQLNDALEIVLKDIDSLSAKTQNSSGSHQPGQNTIQASQSVSHQAAGNSGRVVYPDQVTQKVDQPVFVQQKIPASEAANLPTTVPTTLSPTCRVVQQGKPRDKTINTVNVPVNQPVNGAPRKLPIMPLRKPNHQPPPPSQQLQQAANQMVVLSDGRFLFPIGAVGPAVQKPRYPTIAPKPVESSRSQGSAVNPLQPAPVGNGGTAPTNNLSPAGTGAPSTNRGSSTPSSPNNNNNNNSNNNTAQPNNNSNNSGSGRPGPSIVESFCAEYITIARRRLAEKSTEEIVEVDNEGDNSLHIATYRNVWPLVVAILERLKRDQLIKTVDAQNLLGQTALYIAAVTNQENLVKLFIEYGANVNLFAENVHPSGEREKVAAIHSVCVEGEQFLGTLNALITSSQQDINLVNSSGRTALVLAIENHGKFKPDGVRINSVPVIQALLRAGADPNLQVQQNGKTALMYALESRNLDLIQSMFEMLEPAKLATYVKTQAFDGSTCVKIAESLKSSLDTQSQQRLSACLRMARPAAGHHGNGQVNVV